MNKQTFKKQAKLNEQLEKIIKNKNIGFAEFNKLIQSILKEG